MKYRQLGETGIEVSVICQGTMTWGQQNTEKEAHEQLDYAISRGINFIDTAELYPVPAKAETQGITEKYIGTWLAKRGKRDDLILASKISGPGPYTKHIRAADDFTSESIAEALEGSLKRLQTDYIDLFQIHWPARATNFFGKRGYTHRDGWQNNIEEVVKGLDAIIHSGKVRYVGISNETPWGMMEYIRHAHVKGLSRIQSIQNPYSLLNRTFEIGLAEMAIRENIGLLAYSPMAFGLLSGKYHQNEDKSTDRLNQFKTMSRYNNDLCHKATAEYMKIAKKYGYSLAQMSLAFVNQQPFVTANIIGATDMTQLKENIDSIELNLPKDCLKEINVVYNQIPDPAP